MLLAGVSDLPNPLASCFALTAGALSGAATEIPPTAVHAGPHQELADLGHSPLASLMYLRPLFQYDLEEGCAWLDPRRSMKARTCLLKIGY